MPQRATWVLVGSLFLASAATSWGAARSQLPVIGCKTLDAATSFSGTAVLPRHLPTAAGAPAGVTAQQASMLAWYEGDTKTNDGLKVLAPRGWKCSALLAQDGSWNLTVAPHAARPKQQVQISSHWAGQGAFVACRYFPSARRNAPQPNDCRAPAGTTVSRKNSHLVAITTSPAGSWTPLTDHSFLFWYPKLQFTAEGADCVLPNQEQTLCEVILKDAQNRQSEQLHARLKK
jgi:hypothetical protein